MQIFKWRGLATGQEQVGTSRVQQNKHSSKGVTEGSQELSSLIIFTLQEATATEKEELQGYLRGVSPGRGWIRAFQELFPAAVTRQQEPRAAFPSWSGREKGSRRSRS